MAKSDRGKESLEYISWKLQRLRDHGKIPFTMLGKVTYYDADKIEELMQSSMVVKY